MVELISIVYWNLDEYLKDGSRDNLSALIIAGGWLEGLYLSAELVTTTPEATSLRQHIAEQKLSLQNLIGLLSQYGEDEMLAPTIADLQALEALYEEVSIDHQQGDISKDPDTGEMIIGGTNTITISDEALASILEKAKEIRMRITQ